MLLLVTAPSILPQKLPTEPLQRDPAFYQTSKAQLTLPSSTSYSVFLSIGRTAEFNENPGRFAYKDPPYEFHHKHVLLTF